MVWFLVERKNGTVEFTQTGFLWTAAEITIFKANIRLAGGRAVAVIRLKD